MTTDDWNMIAGQVRQAGLETFSKYAYWSSNPIQIGVTANQCKDQFKPKRSNVRSTLHSMIDGM